MFSKQNEHIPKYKVNKIDLKRRKILILKKWGKYIKRWGEIDMRFTIIKSTIWVFNLKDLNFEMTLSYSV